MPEIDRNIHLIIEHGDEIDAVTYVAALMLVKYDGIDADMGNRPATLAHRRYIGRNMVFAYPGHPNSDVPEEREAARAIAKSIGHYATIALHSPNGYGARTAYIHPERGVSPRALGFLADMGVESLIMSKGEGIEAHAQNSFRFEYDFPSPLMRNPDDKPLIRCLETLANDPHAPVARAADFSWYKEAIGLHVDMYDPYVQGRRLDSSWAKPFERLSPELTCAAGYDYDNDPPLYMFHYREKSPTPDGFWGEAGVAVAAPDDTNWPHRYELAV
ncbi:MAG TPA: hypothetical protein VLF59_03045 [Candidatus Saccharimonadales bacterium]|nr:hypothetical protein [Candidatus Saccharimonadales bacterium]